MMKVRDFLTTKITTIKNKTKSVILNKLVERPHNLPNNLIQTLILNFPISRAKNPILQSNNHKIIIIKILVIK